MRAGPLLLALLCALALPGTAGAATVSMPPAFHSEGNQLRAPFYYYSLTVTAAAGETNRIVADQEDPTRFRVTDTGAPLTAGENCRLVGESAVCSMDTGPRSGLNRADFDLGDGHDELRIGGNWAPAALAALGGPGNDLISAPNSTLYVDGGDGGDTMRALDGTVTYAGRKTGVTVTPDGAANDGESGEGDDVGNFGRIIGGEGDDELHAVDPARAGPETSYRTRIDGGGGIDRLFGGRSADLLYGDAGDDSLLGGDGDDELQGGGGNDVLRGGDGSDQTSFSGGGVDVTLDDRPGDGAQGENDDAGSDIETVIGTPYDDRIVGSDGPNFLQGYGGADLLDGAGGPDRLSAAGGSRLIGGAGPDSFGLGGASGVVEARDGERDEIFCGGTGITYDLDPFDALMNCTPAPIKPDPSTIRVRRDGIARLGVRCTYGNATNEPCVGKFYAYRRGAAGQGSPLARGRFALPPWTERSPSSVGAELADPVFIDLRLTRSARRELARKRRLLVSLQWRAYSDAPPETTGGEYDLKLLAPLKR